MKPLLLASAGEYGMFETFKRYPWVLDIFQYRDQQDLVEQFAYRVVEPAEVMVRKCLARAFAGNSESTARSGP